MVALPRPVPATHVLTVRVRHPFGIVHLDECSEGCGNWPILSRELRLEPVRVTETPVWGWEAEE